MNDQIITCPPVSMGRTLWPHQAEAVKTIHDALAQGTRKQLVAIPTGGGKTTVFSTVVRDILAKGPDGRALILAHRDELLDQGMRDLNEAWPGVSAGFIRAGQEDLQARVIVASVQTLTRQKRLDAFVQAVAPDLRVVVTDEAHHAVASTYLNIYEALGLVAAKPRCLHLGVTATPGRADEKSLKRVYDEMVYEVPINDLIAAGHLVPPRGYLVEPTFSLAGVRTVAGDFQRNALDRAINQPHVNRGVAEAWMKHAADRPTIAFGVSINHAHNLAAAINALAGPGTAAAVDRKTPPLERSRCVEDLRAGRLRILVNCMLFTEGFDAKSISCVLVVRPTQSLPLYAQMVGRGLRALGGKQDCLILDVVDTSRDKKLSTLSSLFYLPERDMQGKTPMEISEEEKQKKCRPTRHAYAYEGANKTIDIIGTAPKKVRLDSWTRKVLNESGLGWLILDSDRYVLSYDLREDERAKRRYIHVRCGDRNDPRWMAERRVYSMDTGQLIESVEWFREHNLADLVSKIVGHVEKRSHVHNIVSEAGRRAWAPVAEPMTDVQKNELRKLGVTRQMQLTKREARDEILIWLACKHFGTKPVLLVGA